MSIVEDFNLKSWSSFALEARAKWATEVYNELQLEKAFAFAETQQAKVLCIGKGCNILFADDFDGLVIRMCIEGIEQVDESPEYVYVKAGGGVDWQELVQWSLKRQLSGIENLTLIPGSVGAAPVQNIGAYGVELKDSLFELEVYDQAEGVKKLKFEECGLAYRNSHFKGKWKGKRWVTSVTLRLNKQARLSVEYGGIKKVLEQRGLNNPTVQELSDVIASIRRSKLPDPDELANAGSFFRNPIVSVEKLSELKAKYPDMVTYPAHSGYEKCAAGWLIDSCSLKGYRDGDAGVHKDQALVLVNYGKASGDDMLQLARYVRDQVLQRFGIRLEPEVEIVGALL
ncbi:MAG: UDP-N-acetylmuramate dehydrogenase [Planctomycetes bacterium]|nr:UDP-N-acetylmuramate dehydrogenase [Planctomycetota bacterium]